MHSNALPCPLPHLLGSHHGYGHFGGDPQTSSHGPGKWHPFLLIALAVHLLGYYATVSIGLDSFDTDDKSDENNMAWIAHMVCFHFVIGCSVLFFLLTWLTDPGTVPHDYDPMKAINQSSPSQQSRAEPLRFCSKCDHYRPARAHHCRLCKKCIMKMDHHCPWVNNCIGLKNQKFFVLFLIYSIITSLYCLISVLVREINHFSQDNAEHDDLSPVDQTIAAVTFLIISPFMVGIGSVLYNQLYFVTKNLTTIEYHDVQRMIEGNGNSFDGGMCFNWKQVMGEWVGLWCLPVAIRLDGMTYPTFSHNTVENA